MKMQGTCTGQKYLPKKMGKWRKRYLGGYDMVRRMDSQSEVLILVQKMLGLCETENGTQIDELLQAGASGHKIILQDPITFSDSRRRQGLCQGGKKLED